MNHNHRSITAIELNDAGIFSLRHHQYRDATDFFRRALTLMKEEHEKHNKTPCSAASTAQKDMHESNHEIIIDLHKEEDEEPPSSNAAMTIRNDKHHHQFPMICKMAIRISAISGTIMMPSTSKKFASAVIYNFAISTHLLGLQIGSRKTLQKALRLYDLAYKTYKCDAVAAATSNNDGTSRTTTTCTPARVIMTTLNNVASIHVLTGNKDFAAKLLQELLVIMAYYCCITPPSSSSRVNTNNNNKCGGQRSWDEICWYNIFTLLLVGPPSTAAAA